MKQIGSQMAFLDNPFHIPPGSTPEPCWKIGAALWHLPWHLVALGIIGNLDYMGDGYSQQSGLILLKGDVEGTYICSTWIQL